MPRAQRFKLPFLRDSFSKSLDEWRARFEKKAVREGRHLIERVESQLKHYDRKLAVIEVRVKRRFSPVRSALRGHARSKSVGSRESMNSRDYWQSAPDISRMNGEGPLPEPSDIRFNRSAGDSRGRPKTRRHARHSAR